MKRKLAIFGVMLLAALAGLSLWLGVQARMLRAELAIAQRMLEAEREAREELEKEAQFKELAHREMREKVYELSAIVAGLRASEANHASNYARLIQTTGGNETNKTNEATGMFGKGMGEMLSKMMKDPAMREMMRGQQKMIFKPVYEPLMKELNLSPEEQQKFMDLFLDQQMTAIEKSQGFFDKTNTDVSEVVEKTKTAVEESEQSMKEFLGEEKFAQYKEYQKTIGERIQLDQFKAQLAGTANPLREDQYGAVMALIREEREKTPPHFGTDGQMPNRLDKLVAGDALEKQLEWQAQINQRVRERAVEVLAPEQLKAFTDFQEQQLNMQKFGMKMAREILGGKKQE